MSDMISRQEVLKLLHALPPEEAMTKAMLIQSVKQMDATQPERKRGKWIEDDDGWDEVIWRCSECDAVFTLVDGTPEENEYYFCPHCGADMRG